MAQKEVTTEKEVITEKKSMSSKKEKKNVALLVNTLGKKPIGLLVEYCNLIKNSKSKFDISKFEGKQISELTNEEITSYLKFREQEKLENRKSEILNILSEYGITIDIDINNAKNQKTTRSKTKLNEK